MIETIASTENQKRIIPLTTEFMKNKKVLDLIWGYLQINSYIGKDPDQKQHRFVYKYYCGSDLSMYDKIIINPLKYTTAEKICCYNTFVNSLNILKKLNYIQDGKILDNNKKVVDVYYLKEDFTPFKLIPYKTLQELQDLYCKNIIKVYTYLLNCYDFKRETQEKYRFTLGELADAVGYTSKGYNQELDNILALLKNNSFIDYHKEKIEVNRTKTYNYFLDYVCIEKVTTTNTNNNTFTYAGFTFDF